MSDDYTIIETGEAGARTVIDTLEERLAPRQRRAGGSRSRNG